MYSQHQLKAMPNCSQNPFFGKLIISNISLRLYLSENFDLEGE